MTVREAQSAITSPEFTEWMAFYRVEAEYNGAPAADPTPDELGAKLKAMASAHNAGLTAPKGKRR